jgi:cobalt-zinc-cadmium efflux system membrane fusion protein
MKTNTLFTFILIAVLTLGLSACSDKHQDVHANEDVHHEDVHPEDDHQEAEADVPHEDLDVVLEEKAMEMIGLTLDVVKERTLYKDVQLSGQIVENNDRLQKVYPRFSGMVKEVFACMGDSVREGQTLATIQNNETLTEYALISALDGIVTKKHVTVGEIIKEDTHIMTIADLKDVWVEFDVHTKDIELFDVRVKWTV